MQNTQTNCSDWRMSYRFSVYQHRLIAPDGQVYSRPFIVVKNKYGVIVRFTNLHNYASIFEGKVYVPLQSDATAKLYYISKMLNYMLIEHYTTFGIDHVFDVSRVMLEQFFRDYAEGSKPNGKYLGEASIEKCVLAVTSFFRSLFREFGEQVLLKPTDLFMEKVVYDRYSGMVVKTVPSFQVRGLDIAEPTFRDLPTKAFKILLNLAFRYAPDIAFAICLQAFAGLRAGEVCNIRQEHSSFGGSIVFTYIGSDVRKAEINLTRLLPMRSDGVVCGRIKRKRFQRVYPSFLDAFHTAYKHHLQWLSKNGFESDYCPMFVNRLNKAMTYYDYKNRFYALVTNHFRPMLLKSEDPECRLYGQLLYEHQLSLQSLRHWFSVQLVLHGEDIAQIQYWPWR